MIDDAGEIGKSFIFKIKFHKPFVFKINFIFFFR